MNKKHIILIIKTLKTHKKMLFFMLFLTLFSSFSWSLLIQNLYKENLKLPLLLLAQELIFPYLQDLCFTPIYNNLLKELKMQTIQQIKSTEDTGKTMTSFNKIHSINLFLKNISSTLTNLSMIIGIVCGLLYQREYQYFGGFAIWITSTTIVFIYTQKYVLQKRKTAWKTTETVFNEVQKRISKSEEFQQNLFKNQSLDLVLTYEANAWKRFYIYSNLSLILIGLLHISFFFTSVLNAPLFLIYIKKINKILKNIKYFVQFTQDFLFIKDEHAKTNDETCIYSKNVKVQNVRIFDSGPFSFEMTSELLIITGENGVGKTLLSKAIANLLPFSGYIARPKTIYISSESQFIQEKLSKGQRLIKHIEVALEQNYELFILDEVLDALSPDNVKKILSKLSEKQVIIITHHSEKYLISNQHKRFITLTRP